MSFRKADPSPSSTISPSFLHNLILSDTKSYYYTSSLNECLYLHYKNIQTISNLQPYINLRVLHLEGNNIKKISGLDTMKQLRSLYLQENVIEKIEGLKELKNLKVLNLVGNVIERVEGLDGLEKLEVLQLKGNGIGGNGQDDLIQLIQCQSLTTLDLSDNRITTPLILPQIFSLLPSLSSLYLYNNPVTQLFPTYRKTFISKLLSLKYLDTKPVFVEERRFVEAWMRGGDEEQKRERIKVREEKENERKRIHQEFRQAVEQFKRGNGGVEGEREEESELDGSLQTYNTNQDKGQIQNILKELEDQIASQSVKQQSQDRDIVLQSGTLKQQFNLATNNNNNP